MINVCSQVNGDDFKQTQVGSKRYLDGMDGISPIVGRLSMLLFLFFAPLLQESSLGCRPTSSNCDWMKVTLVITMSAASYNV